MQPSKVLIGSIAVCALIAFVVGVRLLLSASDATSEQFADLPDASVERPDAPYAVTEDGSYIAIEKADGSAVLIRDVRKRPEATPMGDALYALTSLDATTSTPFGITFNELDGTFAIGLDAEPLGATRTAAEVYFLSMVGIPEQDACALDVYVGTVARVNEFYAGRNLGFSFCEGSVPLPV